MTDRVRTLPEVVRHDVGDEPDIHVTLMLMELVLVVLVASGLEVGREDLLLLG